MDTMGEDDFWAELNRLKEDDNLDLYQSLPQLSLSQPNSPNATATDPPHHYYESIGGATALIPPTEPYYPDVLVSKDHTEQEPMRESLNPAAGAIMPPPLPSRRSRFLSDQQRSYRRPLSCDFSRKITRTNTSVESGEVAVSSSHDRIILKEKVGPITLLHCQYLSSTLLIVFEA